MRVLYLIAKGPPPTPAASCSREFASFLQCCLQMNPKEVRPVSG